VSDTLTAALVSGMLSGLVVLTGVVLAEVLRRRSDLRERQRRSLGGSLPTSRTASP
jgi:hypothetical protein